MATQPWKARTVRKHSYLAAHHAATRYLHHRKASTGTERMAGRVPHALWKCQSQMRGNINQTQVLAHARTQYAALLNVAATAAPK
mmetsp:Transcript_111989/g.156994  ORF Transcript_111989/g.156994 Transcript_111989/m.156994 type:complete len:85 (-) Transcript_111989:104-358(-)